MTVSVAVPQRLDDAAAKALHDFAEATKGFDPRAGLLTTARSAETEGE